MDEIKGMNKMIDTLYNIGCKYGTDKTTHGYCPYYETHLPGRDEKFNLLEIGIFDGGSLRMWKEYFYNATIYGIDIDSRKIFQEDRIITFWGDATLEGFLNSLNLPDLSVIIDDGSHQANDIVKTYNLLWKKLNKGGFYVIEDLAVQWTYPYGGSPDGSLAIRDIEKRLAHTLRENDMSEFHAYTEIVFLKK